MMSIKKYKATKFFIILTTHMTNIFLKLAKIKIMKIKFLNSYKITRIKICLVTIINPSLLLKTITKLNLK